MKTKSILAALLIALIFSVGCTAPTTGTSSAEPTTTVEATTESATEAGAKGIKTNITPEEAQKLIGQEDVYLIDVRTPEEYSEGHIPGAMNIPLDKLESIQMIVPYADKTMIVYCRSGSRSAEAANQLEAYGYLKIYDLGGIINWPYAVE